MTRSTAPDGLHDGAELVVADLPPAVRDVLQRLAGGGHQAALVGGCLRDIVLGELPGDWDVGTSALPEAVAAAFPGATWANPFGTVTVRGEPPVEVTSYRTEAGYSDRRRPDVVRFGGSLADDLARRDFTVNAMAWLPLDLATGRGRLQDPFGGLEDLRAGRLVAVGDPDARLAEDALRLLRAVRFATRLDLELDADLAAAIRHRAPDAASLSGERTRDELLRLLAHGGVPPSRPVRLLEELGLLAVVLPELAALRGIPQGKPIAGDALDHSLRTADALPPRDPILRLAGLLHDVGKAPTMAGGHFVGHERVGAEMAGRILRRLRLPAADLRRVTHLVEQHMFGYRPDWTDAAVRRFIRRVGPGALPDLFALREADDVASGAGPEEAARLRELRRRVEGELAAAPLEPRHLAIDGHDLQAELGLEPGPALGRVIEQLMDAVLEDPRRNERQALLELARRLADGGAPVHREPGAEDPAPPP